MDWFLHDNGLRLERVKCTHSRRSTFRSLIAITQKKMHPGWLTKVLGIILYCGLDVTISSGKKQHSITEIQHSIS